MNSPSRFEHPFTKAPHKTMWGLSVPVLFSLIAEPLTGLVDTAFIASLGAPSLAALGVGTIVLSSIFWIFNFLGIGTQTQVAQADGAGNRDRVARINAVAMCVALGLGILALVAGWFGSEAASRLMGAEGEVKRLSSSYMQIRVLGAPAVLLMLTGFGTLRGQQAMRLPMIVALSTNLLNVVMDYVLIFGWGPIPAMGFDGAAWASVLSQYVGALWTVGVIIRSVGLPDSVPFDEVWKLFKIGGDLFVRTASLTLFLLLTTRAATRIGTDAGAAHQAIRQVWTFSALLLDAFAISGQSLTGYFLGANHIKHARNVARVVCMWSLAAGSILLVLMFVGETWVQRLLVPASAISVFSAAWFVSAISQPVNALTFATDGIHWGTGDFRYLRNSVLVSTILGAVALYFLDEKSASALVTVWWITAGWITVRAIFGMVRIWPGIGQAPLRADP